MEEILKVVIKDAIKSRKKYLKDSEIWLKQDMESLQQCKNSVSAKQAGINKIKAELAILEKLI